ncbi:RlmE family RNA methyltransferase [Candidatus Gracilibacteria bacterium]|nr:RlmE family RNA methyltransferase [Candidatus Gracilibacteria bacterium]
MLKKKKKIVAPRVANKAGYQVQDVWFHRAKAAGYRARSAYKLLQIQEKTSLIRPDTLALDLGCAPGSWLQVLSQIVGENGRILGVDLQEVDKFSQKHITTLVGDMMASETHEKIRDYLSEIQAEKMTNDEGKIADHQVWGINDRDKLGFQLITSDVAPKTTGRTDDDQYHSAMLCLEVLKIAEKFLTPGGSLVMKIFVGRDLGQVLHKAKYMFKKIQTIKPVACRDRSFEEYVVCKGFNS